VFYILQNAKYIISLLGILIESVIEGANGIAKGVVNIGSSAQRWS
jgi:hypothetical protein